MIFNLDGLKKIGDLINSEGSILSLYLQGDMYYLGSYLVDKTGTLYYSTSKKDLSEYINSQINLNELYLRSDDFIVQTKFRGKILSYLKSDMIGKIKCGELYYKDIPNNMRGENVEIET
jgi:hypothetical protein